MQTKLSIIVPVYKVEPYIRQCLDSLVNQTFQDIEIICIDDGSPDSCGKICDEYAEKFPTVKVYHKQNGGLVNAWTDGMKMASGEYLTFVDSDDWVDTDFYERMFAALGDRDADVFCAGGRYIEKNDKTEVIKTLEEPFYYQNGKHRAEIIARTLVGWPTERKNEILCDLGYVWDKIYKTSLIKGHVLGWNKKPIYGPWPDALLELNIFVNASKIGGCLEIGNHYRLNVAGSATTRFWKNLPESCKNWAEDAHEVLENDPAFKEPVLQDAFNARCQMMMLMSVAQYYMHPENTDSYLARAKKYREFKNSKYFKESLRYKTPYRTVKSNFRTSIMRYTGLWSQYVIKWLKSIIK